MHHSSSFIVTEPSEKTTTFSKKRTASIPNLNSSPQKIASKLFFQIPEIRPKHRASQPDQQHSASPIKKAVVAPMSFENFKARAQTPKPERSSNMSSATRKRLDRSQTAAERSPDFARNQSPISTQRPCTTTSTRREGHERNNSFVVPAVALYVEKKARERSSELRAKTSQENKRIHNKGKSTGGDGLNTTIQRREVERQVQCMENRIKRLQFEEMQTQKKINQVMEKTQKVLASKTRYEEDLANKEMRNQKREMNEQQRREEINREKEEAKLNQKKQKLNRWKSKFEDAYALKKTKEDFAKLAEAKRKEEEEKRKEAARRTREWEKMSQKMKNMKYECNSKSNADKYEGKVQMEKSKTQELEAKIKQLEEMEKDLLARAGVTRSIHNAKLAELEHSKVMNIRDQKASFNGNEMI